MSHEDGNRAYEGFQGRVGRTFASSSPWWPPEPTPPPQAPNVIVVLADDLGFSDLGCYGSEIETPNIDRLAERGARFSNFHVAPLCSPTRASLLTGLNPHAAGVGFVANIDPGFPGYASELPDHQPSMAEVFRANGYGTFMVGKWHLTKEQELHEAGDRRSWPLQRGFDQYYGFLEALTNLHNPHRLFEGNSVVQMDDYPDDYYLTDDLTQRAQRMILESKAADPEKPFFLYYAHGAVHAPLHAKQEDIERHRAQYDQGWDRVREQRFKRIKQLGLLPDTAELPPRNSEPGEEVPAWDDLSSDEKRLFARYMEIYAAMVTSIDDSVGGLLQTLEALDALDNTLFVFLSDNGASREGMERGTSFYFRGRTAEPGRISHTDADLRTDLTRISEMGGPTTWPHYPRGWAMVSNTPFRLYKTTTHAGGHQVPLVVSWPRGLEGRGRVVRDQYTYVGDLLPTLIELLDLEMPDERDGQPRQDFDGTSVARMLLDPSARSWQREQYLECVGNRAYHRNGWEVVTHRRPLTPFSEERWSLYDTATDPTQCHDLADEYPERVEELVQAWERAAWDNQVFPLYEGGRIHGLIRREDPLPPGTTRRILRATPTLDRVRSSELIADRSFEVDIDWLHRVGDQGILLAHGGQDFGYVLYVLEERVHFAQNAHGVMRHLEPVLVEDGCQHVRLGVEAPGEGRWLVSLAVDGAPAIPDAHEFDQPAGFLPFEGIDVGIDRRSPVSWELYQRHGTFAYTGDLRSVSYQLGEFAPDAESRRLEELMAYGTALE